MSSRAISSAHDPLNVGHRFHSFIHFNGEKEEDRKASENGCALDRLGALAGAMSIGWSEELVRNFDAEFH